MAPASISDFIPLNADISGRAGSALQQSIKPKPSIIPSFLRYLPNGSLSMTTLLLSVALFEVTLLAVEATQHLKKGEDLNNQANWWT